MPVTLATAAAADLPSSIHPGPTSECTPTPPPLSPFPSLSFSSYLSPSLFPGIALCNFRKRCGAVAAHSLAQPSNEHLREVQHAATAGIAQRM